VTFSSFVGIALTLAIVLGLVAITLRLLRRVAVGAGSVRGSLPMEVVQRLALGPRQGIAVVRIGEQLVAVSVGEGGVRPLLELDGDVALTSAPVRTPSANGSRDFRAMLRSAGVPLVILMMAVSLVAPAALRAQAAQGATPAQRPASKPPATQQPPAQKAAAPATPTAAKAAAPVAQTPAAPAPATAAKAAPTISTTTDALINRAAPQIDLKLNGQGKDSGLHLSGTVGVVIMMGLLTLLPTLMLMMTGFTRILIVLHFLRQALGTQSAPPAQLISALALLLTGFVMAPTLSEVNRTALTPWMDGKIEQAEMMSAAIIPMREFMLRQTRERDIATFVEMSRTEPPKTVEEVSTVVLMSAFVTSELRTAFQLGFALFLPFIIIDLVVSSVLMSMGMFMLPPAMISLPFKLLLFVLVDGWSLIVQSLVAGFK
jgi:flagellar biosynthetic protein FliP